MELWGIYYSMTNALTEVRQTHIEAVERAGDIEREVFQISGRHVTYFVRPLTLVEVINYLLKESKR